jgi:Rrf2 family cysteine metabolism transcriptional repressor
MKFTTKSQYGLRAMVYLARHKKEVSPLKIIAEIKEIPVDYLEKIINNLEKAGFVKAKRGMKGGYFLNLEPEEIKLGEVIRALEGPTAPVKCLIKKREKRYRCPREKRCQTKKIWKEIQDSLDSTLNSMTLADFV